MQRKVRLTESQLNTIIKKSVRHFLKEETDMNQPKRKIQKIGTKKERQQRYGSFPIDSFNKHYLQYIDIDYVLDLLKRYYKIYDYGNESEIAQLEQELHMYGQLFIDANCKELGEAIHNLISLLDEFEETRIDYYNGNSYLFDDYSELQFDCEKLYNKIVNTLYKFED